MLDLSVEVRELVVAAMSATAPASAVQLICADRIYGPSAPPTPQWPFVRTDLPVVTPDPNGCGPNSTRCTFNVHGFAKGDDERAGAALGKAIMETLDELAGQVVASPEAVVTDTVWTGTQVFRDTAEANGWHAVVSFYCLIDA